MARRRLEPLNQYLAEVLIQRGLDPNNLKNAAERLEIPYRTLLAYSKATPESKFELASLARDCMKLGIPMDEFVSGLIGLARTA